MIDVVGRTGLPLWWDWTRVLGICVKTVHWFEQRRPS